MKRSHGAGGGPPPLKNCPLLSISVSISVVGCHPPCVTGVAQVPHGQPFSSSPQHHSTSIHCITRSTLLCCINNSSHVCIRKDISLCWMQKFRYAFHPRDHHTRVFFLARAPGRAEARGGARGARRQMLNLENSTFPQQLLLFCCVCVVVFEASAHSAETETLLNSLELYRITCAHTAENT